MQYLGGKSRIARQLAEVIDSVREPGQLVWDAFCGSLAASKTLSTKGPVWSTDACLPLIALYHAIQSGWVPPTSVSREDYELAKTLPDTDPMKAFCGFGCSFSGKWFGGYAKSSRPDRVNGYAHGVAKVLCRDVQPHMSIDCVDFLSVDPQDLGCILYLDPPYAGTTGYGAVCAFDHGRFISRVLEWSKYVDVFVSEYNFPIGECVWQKTQTTTVSRDKTKYEAAVERLYFIPRGYEIERTSAAAVAHRPV